MPRHLVAITRELDTDEHLALMTAGFREVPPAKWTAAPDAESRSTWFRYEAKDAPHAIADALTVLGPDFNRAVAVVGHQE